MYECRDDERLKTKTEESTLLAYTGLLGELEHLKIMTRLIDEMFASVMGEYVLLFIILRANRRPRPECLPRPIFFVFRVFVLQLKETPVASRNPITLILHLLSHFTMSD